MEIRRYSHSDKDSVILLWNEIFKPNKSYNDPEIVIDMKVKTKLIESVEFQTKINQGNFAKFCEKDESVYFQSIINNEEMKDVYSKGVLEILKSIFVHGKNFLYF